MSTPYEEYDDKAVDKAVKQAVTTVGWFAVQIVGCVVTAILLAGVATLATRYFW